MPGTPTDRAHERLAWTRRITGLSDLKLVAASADASFRSYWRTVGTDTPHVVMDAPPQHEDITPWCRIRDNLEDAGVHVPAVHAADIENGFLLMEDLGQRQYLADLTPQTVDARYGEAMDALLTMQAHADTGELPPYDTTRLHDEMELMPAWFLQAHLGYDVDTALRQILDDAFGMLTDNALEQPACFVHRDYHSRNLMLTPHHAPGVIDFQDAVRGPITYDLVSLLRDCYIRWDKKQVRHWCEHYRQRLLAAGLLNAQVHPQQFQRWFDLMGLQRHLKVLGIFARLALRDGKRQYLDDLPRVLDYVLRVAADYPALSPLRELLVEATTGRDLTRARTSDTGNSACAP